MESDKLFDDLLSSFTKCSEKPEDFLVVQPDVSAELVSQTKSLYDFSRLTLTLEDGALPELITDNFDDEQIWQEIELQNDPCIGSMLSKVSQLAAAKRYNFDLVDDEGEKPKIKSIKKAAVLQPEVDVDGDIDEDEEEDEDIGDDDQDQESDVDLGGVEEEEDGSDAEERRLEEALDKLNAPEEEDDDDDEEEEDDDDDDDGIDVSAIKKKVAQAAKAKSQKPADVKKRKTVVDDKFFKMADMEAFLEQEDAKEEKRQRLQKGEEQESEDEEDDGEDVDMFAEDDEEEEDEEDESGNVNYKDFFDPPDGEEEAGDDDNEEDVDDDDEEEEEEDDDEGSDEEGEETGGSKKKVSFMGSSDEDEGEDADAILGRSKEDAKSQFEKRQEKLKKKIGDIEDGMTQDKPWQLKGEVGAGARPENSLLQEDVDFEHTTRVNPTITEESTLSLEEFIKQRIKDKVWDDVERKDKPKENPYEYKKRVVLDQEKSKMSLGEIYEKEFVKQANDEEQEEENPEHEGIRKMMTSLFVKLDALTNFHFTPKPSAPEVKIVSNLPSIVMEEVAPTSVSDAAMLAPEEVHDKERKEAKGDTEKDATDKKRMRRDKKKRQREKARAKDKKARAVEKLNPGLGNKYAKEKAMADLEKQSKHGAKGVTLIKDDKSKKKELSSSTKFFTQLQDEVRTQIKEKSQRNKHKKDKSKLSSAKLKL